MAEQWNELDSPVSPTVFDALIMSVSEYGTEEVDQGEDGSEEIDLESDDLAMETSVDLMQFDELVLPSKSSSTTGEKEELDIAPSRHSDYLKLDELENFDQELQNNDAFIIAHADDGLELEEFGALVDRAFGGLKVLERAQFDRIVIPTSAQPEYDELRWVDRHNFHEQGEKESVYIRVGYSAAIVHRVQLSDAPRTCAHSC